MADFQENQYGNKKNIDLIGKPKTVKKILTQYNFFSICIGL